MPKIAELVVQLKAENKDLKAKLQESKKEVGGFGKSVASIAKAGAFLLVAQQAGKLLVSMSALSSQTEGVRVAFHELAGVTLKDLRAATQGTVSDFKLMQAAVKAENFKIPLEQLAGYFEFATNRAKATGESVDYLVESIINGIGRKSSLVLDNLGISAAELQEEIKKVGDFATAAGNIIAREGAKMSDNIKGLRDPSAELNAEWDNLKRTFSELGSGSVGNMFVTFLKDVVKEMDNMLKITDDKDFQAFWKNFWYNNEIDYSLLDQSKVDGISGSPTAPRDYQNLGPMMSGRGFGGVRGGLGGGLPSVSGVPNTTLSEIQVDTMRMLNEEMELMNELLREQQEEMASLADSLREVEEARIKSLRAAVKDFEDLQLAGVQAIGQTLLPLFSEFALSFTNGKGALQDFLEYFKRWALQMAIKLATLTALAAVLNALLPGLGGGKTGFTKIFGALGGGNFQAIGGLFGDSFKESQSKANAASMILSGADLRTADSRSSRYSSRINITE